MSTSRFDLPDRKFGNAPVTTVFPEVMVVADRFHVVQNLHKAIHDVRRLAQKQAETEEESQQLKGLRYLLLKNEANLSARDQERLQVLLEQQPILYQLWKLRQQLHDWYETDTSIEQAGESLQDWLDQASQLQLKPLDDFCKTLRNWRAEILNFFAFRLTSGFVEGMNNKIKLLKRIAFGIPNFSHFRLRIIAACG